MARVLIVGCGCRGRALASALAGRGHAVRGTSREPEGAAAIERSGAEGRIGDPDRLATLMGHVEGVAVLCWLMGTAAGTPEAVAALHGPRVASMVEALVDTHVRGFVYEAAGSVDAALLAEGARRVREVAGANRMPVQVVDRDPADHGPWVAAMVGAVESVLAA